MSVGVQRNAFHTAIDNAQLDAFVVTSHQQRFSKRIWKRSAVEGEVIGTCIGNVIVAMHRSRDQTRIVVLPNPLAELLVQVLIM